MKRKTKKIIAGVLSIILSFALSLTIFAFNDSKEKTPEHDCNNISCHDEIKTLEDFNFIPSGIFEKDGMTIMWAEDLDELNANQDILDALLKLMTNLDCDSVIDLEGVFFKDVFIEDVFYDDNATKICNTICCSSEFKQNSTNSTNSSCTPNCEPYVVIVRVNFGPSDSFCNWGYAYARTQCDGVGGTWPNFARPHIIDVMFLYNFWVHHSWTGLPPRCRNCGWFQSGWVKSPEDLY